MITSTTNTKIKRLTQLQKKSRARTEEGVFILEGPRIFAEVPQEQVQEVYVSESWYQKQTDHAKLQSYHPEILADRVFAHVSDTKTPQGVLCVARQPVYRREQMLAGKAPLLLFLDNLQDPGNIGTIMRTAVGAGVTGIILSKDCADIYNPKTVRAAMGVVYRIPFLYVPDLPAEIRRVRQAGIRTFAAHLDGAKNYDQAGYTGGTAFLIGNEGNGLRPETAVEADEMIKIPMQGELESLNAAVASAVLVFEASRQRRNDKSGR